MLLMSASVNVLLFFIAINTINTNLIHIFLNASSDVNESMRLI